LIAKDGRQLPIDDNVAPIRDEHGNVTGIVLIFRDVAERRRSEMALRDADRRKDEFLAILAHELRNPLAPICTALEIMRTPAADAVITGRAKDVMGRQLQHLVRLVDDLMDVSRIMRGKIELRKETVDVRSIASRAIEAAQSVIDAQGHQLSLSLPSEPVLLTTDPVRLAQVINNLLTNAAKYTEPGGRISLEVATASGEVVIRVRDNGIGIPGEMLPQVFDMFTQVDSSASRSQGGLGIGLTLVKSLVELDGGRVEAHSEGAGKGSEFVVRLPSCRGQVAVSHPAASEIAHHHVPKRRVLVVDDNVDAAETLATLLRLKGHAVDIAYDGPSAIEAANRHAPEIVFLDIGMPGMDGLAVASRLRSSPAVSPHPLLVAVTGWGQDEDRRRTERAGFDFHLVKPVSPIEVGQLLARAEAVSAQPT
jgi:signal transduction histidine kinase/CheY-like chemotaxis protein